MKITKKILISSLAISPLTTLAFIPSIVRPKEVKTYGNNYTKDIDLSYDSANKPEDFFDIIKELIKEFDIDITIYDLNSLATKIEAKRNELNFKITVNKERIRGLKKLLKEGDGGFLDPSEIKLLKFCIENLNYKLKLLEEVENKVFSKIMKDDYKKSMKKYYSSDALATTIAKILKEANNLEGIIKFYQGSSFKEEEKEIVRKLSLAIGAKIEILNKLNTQRKMLEKHFTLDRKMINQYYQILLRSRDDD